MFAEISALFWKREEHVPDDCKTLQKIMSENVGYVVVTIYSIAKIGAVTIEKGLTILKLR